MTADKWLSILQACVPILVAFVGIIPTVIANRKKTQESLKDMQNKIVEDINNTKTEVTDIQTKLKEHIEEEDEHRAKQARYRFLRFYDEVCAGLLHSESHWEDVLDDVDFYEKYCAKHPEFKNSRGGIAKDYLKDAYREDKAHGRFLTHKHIDAKGA